MLTTLLEPLLFGGLVGLILALTGAGGGILAVPLLVFGLHLPMAQAAPVGLLAVGLAAGVGAVLAFRQGLLRYRAAALIGGLGIVSTPAGLWLAARIPNAPLMIAFAVVLGWVAIRMLRQFLRNGATATGADTVRLDGDDDEGERALAPCVLAADGRLHWTFPCAQALAMTGLLSGLLSGLLGVGGGFVIVPALNRYTVLSMQSIVATSLGVITLVSLGGSVSAALSGALVWAIALPFGGGAVVGLLGGRLLAAHLAGPRLQGAFGAVSLIVAVMLAIRGLNGLIG